MKTYCVYTNRYTDDPSPEHIIPLSLGGLDEFVIDVDRKFNNDIGSKVDGQLSNDFLVMFQRRDAGVKGHSGKDPRPIVKHAKLNDGSPAQVTFSTNGLEIFDSRNKSLLKKTDKRGGTIEINTQIDIDIDLMFVAKVALSAGYFAYGNDFKNHVDIDEFRKIMNLDKSNLPEDSTARVYNRFHAPEEFDEMYHILKMATELSDCSSVIMAPSMDSFGVAVGILGKFLGFISVHARSVCLPNYSEYRFGHCVYVHKGKVRRSSFDNILMQLLKKIEDNQLIEGTK